MLATHALLAVLTLMTSPSTTSYAPPPSAAEDFTHRVVGPSAQLAHATRDLWRAALASRKSRTADQDEMVRAVFAFAGASEMAASRLGSHDCNREEADEILRDLEALAAETDKAIDQTPTTGDLRRAWDGAQAAWQNLRDRAAGIAPPPTTTGATGATGATGGTGPTGTTGANADFNASISEARWSGLVNPDLKLSGTFTGKDMVKGEIEVADADGKVVYSNSDKLTAQIATATSGKSTSTPVTVNWTYSLENEDLASGENTITIAVTNGTGARAWTKRQITRKQFP